MFRYRFVGTALALLLVLFLAACNLTSSPEEPIDNTPIATLFATQTVTPASSGVPTTIAVTALPGLTSIAPTSIGFFPTAQFPQQPTPSLISIFIASPIPGNVLAGNVQVIGSAAHPSFLQYYLEYGPDPNPGNLWYPIGGARLSQVVNGLLGIWTTNTIPDGNYQLRLRVFLRDGSTSQTVVNNLRVQNTAPTIAPTIVPTNAIPRPIAAFSPSTYQGRARLTVSFTNYSSGNISNYLWDFGDGTTSTDRNPVHTFNRQGEYLVQMVAIGPGGRSNPAIAYINVQTAEAPTANFTASTTSGVSPLTVRFTNTSTGQITRAIWDFGDGVTQEDTNSREVSHTFTYREENKGVYNVILAVRGPGGTSRKLMTITVQNPVRPAPVADFEPRNVQEITAPATIKFTNRSTGATGYTWDFGNGLSSTDPNPTTTYAQEGTYTVRLVASGEGGSTTVEGTVRVVKPPQAPDASFTASPIEGTAPLTVNFTDTSTGTITGRSWSFGDGSTGTDTNTSHTYQTPGTYTVRLTVQGQNGTSDFAEQVISVREPTIPLNADFTANPLQGTAPLDVTFNNLSTGTNLTYNWNFGDGTTSTSADPVITHRYETNGSYTVTLTVNNDQGQTDTAQAVINVSSAATATFTIEPPTATHTAAPATAVPATSTFTAEPATAVPATSTFTAEPPTAVPATATFTAEPPTNTPAPAAPTADFNFTIDPANPLTVNFTDLSQGEGITTWVWNFGDPNATTDNTQNPVFTYPTGGTFSVTLTVANAGGTNAITKQVTVTAPTPTATNTVEVPVPVADFTFEAVGLTVQFTDASTGENITTWAWDFGDDTTDNTQNPEHTYAAPGTYSVTLTVTNGAGGTNSATYDVTVEDVATLQDSVADTTEILPDIQALSPNVDPARDPDVFAITGDASSTSAAFLRRFVDGGTLDADRQYLDATIQDYITSGAFGRTSVASGDLRINQLVTETPDGCNGETRFVCELTQSNASIVVISVGLQDARQQTAIESFRADLETLVDQATARGVIPVLLTIYPRPGNEDLILPFNEQIIEVAEDRGVPVINIWRMVNEASEGINAEGNLSIFSGGADVLTAETINIFGENSRNFYVLDVLHNLRQQFLGQ